MRLVIFFLFAFCIKGNAQTIIDYQSWSSSACNIFGTATNVPATINGSSSNITHLTTLGQPTYSSANSAIALDGNYTSNNFYGTEYRIAYSFKQNYSYTIKINTASISNTGAFPQLRLKLLNTTNSNNQCNSYQLTDNITTGNLIQAATISSNVFNDVTLSFNAISSANSYLTIGILSALNGGLQTIVIRKVTITETAPPPTFTISPSSLTIPCSSTTAQTFTVNNVYNSPGTLSYDWDLTSSNNGWIYNGSAAPQTFTTSTNSITLTPNSSTLSNVKVTVKLNAVAQPQLTSTVTVSSNPGLNLSINAPSSLCTSGVFSVNNLPSGATVTWSASPSGSVYISPSGNSATISNQMDPGGYANITATVTVGSGCTQQVTASDIYFGSYPTTGTYSVAYSNPITANTVNYVPPYDNIALTINNLTATGYTIQKVFGNANIFVSGNTVSFSLGEYSQTYPNDGTITLSTTASTPCGTISQAFTFTTQGQCGSCFGAYYSVSPNPAAGNVKVKANKEDKKTASENKIYRIGIYDQYGTLLKSYNYNGVEEATLNVSGIKPGLYILRIFDGKTEHSERLSIAR